jgi:acyl-CoA dehydrogenase
MIQLDAGLLGMRALMREWGLGMRSAGLEVDRDPDAIGRHVGLPGLASLARTPVPADRDPGHLRVAGRSCDGMSAFERVVSVEELAYGDAGMFLGAPGGSMSGVLIDLLGDEEQKDWYYSRLLQRPTWTFFALTEPDRGSDAAALSTTLTPRPDGGGVLNGAKRYIGNGARAEFGVVFCRTGKGPLGVTAVIVDAASAGFAAEPIPTIGLRGAQISALTFDDVEVPADRVLGRHLPATRRGLWSAVRTFNLLRPGVAAIALGIAGAALDYAEAEYGRPRIDERNRLDAFRRQTAAVRELTWRAALAADRDPSDGRLASAAKYKAARLAEQATLAACELLGPGARLEHPLLDKFVRDARGVEFMEGAGDIQRLNIFHGFSRTGGRIDDHDGNHSTEDAAGAFVP